MIPVRLKNGLKKITPLYSVFRYLTDKREKIKDVTYTPDFTTKADELSTIFNQFSDVDILIETGTYLGDMVYFFKDRFHQLYSIELSEALAEKAANRFKEYEKIRIIQGNSGEELGRLLKNITSPCIFWLDGHYSSEFWVGTEFIKTAKGDKNTPIIEELIQIRNHTVKNHVVLIDDARLFSGADDYPDIRKLSRFVAKGFPSHNFEIMNDIIRILPKYK